jgi:Leucine-rich repeat (LRR) protein
MIQPINESEKNRIRNLHRKHFILNEQARNIIGVGHRPPEYLSLRNEAYDEVTFDFPEIYGTNEDTRRIDINNSRGMLTPFRLMELSNFPNLKILHINGGVIESLPPEAITPNLTFLSLPSTKIGDLPLEVILNSNIKTLNLRKSQFMGLTPDDMDMMRERGINVII